MFYFDKKNIIHIFRNMCIKYVCRICFKSRKILALLLSIPGVLIAITFHEYAHAWTAYKLGDDTAKSQGRLSLNPLKHMDQ